MRDFEKRNIEDLVEQISDGLRAHDLFLYPKYDGQYPCSVNYYIPYEGEENAVAYVSIYSYKTGKCKYLTEHELYLFAKWLDDLNYVEGTILTVEHTYGKAKDDLVKKVAAWVS